MHSSAPLSQRENLGLAAPGKSRRNRLPWRTLRERWPLSRIMWRRPLREHLAHPRLRRAQPRSHSPPARRVNWTDAMGRLRRYPCPGHCRSRSHCPPGFAETLAGYPHQGRSYRPRPGHCRSLVHSLPVLMGDCPAQDHRCRYRRPDPCRCLDHSPFVPVGDCLVQDRRFHCPRLGHCRCLVHSLPVPAGDCSAPGRDRGVPEVPARLVLEVLELAVDWPPAPRAACPRMEESGLRAAPRPIEAEDDDGVVYGVQLCLIRRGRDPTSTARAKSRTT
jgi:hypothetical protein